jgi:NTP pyrophosphatase (non-canonical NTP hydrolase)
MDSLISKVRSANLKRKKKNIDRRLLKLGEEYGEANQAFLSITSKHNSKKKTWEDVREELCDVVIVALDILLTEMPDEEFKEDQRSQRIEDRIYSEIDRKLSKWIEKTKLREFDADSETE